MDIIDTDGFKRDQQLYKDLKQKIPLTKETRDIYFQIIKNNYTRHILETIELDDTDFFKSENIDHRLIKNYGDLSYLSSDQIYQFLSTSNNWLKWEPNIFSYSDCSLKEIFNQENIQLLLKKSFFRYFIIVDDLNILENENDYYQHEGNSVLQFIRSRQQSSVYDFIFHSPVYIDPYYEFCGVPGHSMGCSDIDTCLIPRRKEDLKCMISELKELKNLYDYCDKYNLEFDNQFLIDYSIELRYIKTIPDYIYKYTTLYPKDYYWYIKYLKEFIFDSTKDLDIRRKLFDNLIKTKKEN